MNLLKIILLTLTTLIYAFTGVLNADVDEDCFCNIKDGVAVEQDIYVDTCNGISICDGTNKPFYYGNFTIGTDKDYGFSKKDTGLINIEKFPENAKEFFERFESIDDALQVIDLHRDLLSGYNFFTFTFKIKRTQKFLDSILISKFGVVQIFYPEYIVLSGVNELDINNYNVNVKKNNLNLNSNSIINNVRIYTVEGKNIYKENEINSTNFHLFDIEKGIYFIIIDNKIFTKFVISY